MITVDCGIGSAEEVEALIAAGIDVVVTDHHEPPERLPACPSEGRMTCVHRCSITYG